MLGIEHINLAGRRTNGRHRPTVVGSKRGNSYAECATRCAAGVDGNACAAHTCAAHTCAAHARAAHARAAHARAARGAAGVDGDARAAHARAARTDGDSMGACAIVRARSICGTNVRARAVCASNAMAVQHTGTIDAANAGTI